MDGSSAVQAIERLFNDIIGSFIPGFSLIIGFLWSWPQPVHLNSLQLFPPEKTHGWIIVIVAAYVLSHIVSSMGGVVFRKVLEPLLSKGMAPNSFKTADELGKRVKSTTGYVELKLYFERFLIKELNRWQDMRNLTMSLSTVNDSKVDRFRFLSLFHANMVIVVLVFICYSVVMMVIIAVSSELSASNLYYVSLTTRSGMNYLGGVGIAGALVIAWLLVERHYRFHTISMHIPINMAFATLAVEGTLPEIKR